MCYVRVDELGDHVLGCSGVITSFLRADVFRIALVRSETVYPDGRLTWSGHANIYLGHRSAW
jgi:hypothetical protein